MCGVFGAMLACGLGEAAAQNGPKMTKIDPPNWWAGMPKPMLLIQGEHLQGAQFRLSDARLRVEKVHVSENGHWAQLWLNASPVKAETVTITVQGSGGTTTLPFTFAARRKASSMAWGRSARDYAAS
jgi:hypothetical protein